MTKKGNIKVVDGSEFDVSRRTIAATKLMEGDIVLSVFVHAPQSSIIFESDKEYFLRIASAEIPEKKKAAVGVRGMDLTKGDELKAVYMLPEGGTMSVPVHERKVLLDHLKIAGRATKGSKK